MLSLIGHVRHSYRPHITLLTPDASGLWEPTVARPGLETAPGLIVYRFGADLFYANVDRFADKAREVIATAPSPVRGFVIDAGALTDIDFSAGRTFRDLLAELKDRQIDVVMGRVSADLRLAQRATLVTQLRHEPQPLFIHIREEADYRRHCEVEGRPALNWRRRSGPSWISARRCVRSRNVTIACVRAHANRFPAPGS